MAAATKCDLSGQVVAGAPTRYVDVDVTPTLRVRAIVLVKKSPTTWEQGDLGPEGVEALTKALKAVQAKATGK